MVASGITALKFCTEARKQSKTHLLERFSRPQRNDRLLIEGGCFLDQRRFSRRELLPSIVCKSQQGLNKLVSVLLPILFEDT